MHYIKVLPNVSYIIMDNILLTPSLKARFQRTYIDAWIFPHCKVLINNFRDKNNNLRFVRWGFYILSGQLSCKGPKSNLFLL